MRADGPRVFKEGLNPHFGFYYTIRETLYKGRTRFQKIELVDTHEFGKTLLLDNITQVVEKNDYQYHEPMVHPAMCTHPRPRDVLVIGGGDGGILREVLRYPCVRTVHFAELDEDVVRFSREYLSSVNRGAFDDPRVRLNFTDGRRFVELRENEFDVVIMDMTDPLGPSKMLYTKEFFAAVRRSLRGPEGIFVMHSESPIARPVAFNCIAGTLGRVYGVVAPLYLYIQMYAVLWSICISSEASDPRSVRPSTVDRRLARYGIDDLNVYNGATHRAMLTPYPYIERILAGRPKIITDGNPDFPDEFTGEREAG